MKNGSKYECAKPLLEVRNISKAFGGIQALFGVSFEVFPGDIFGIIGPNGSGKTTLVNCVTGFVRVNSGTVLFQGRDITNRPPHKIADLGVTRTFQIMRPYYSLPAYKNLIIPLVFASGPAHRRLAGRRQTGGPRHGGD